MQLLLLVKAFDGIGVFAHWCPSTPSATASASWFHGIAERAGSMFQLLVPDLLRVPCAYRRRDRRRGQLAGDPPGGPGAILLR
jgi:hypothetical protein